MEVPRRRLVLTIAGVIAAVLIFVAGYLPGRWRANRAVAESRESAQRLKEAQSELAKTRFDLQVALLRGRLGEVLHEANANNFGIAAERATAFFDGVRAVVNDSQLAPGSARRSVLEAMLARRDEISADLARADPTAKPKLSEMYMHFARATD